VVLIKIINLYHKNEILYYWHNSANQYKSVGTFFDIKFISNLYSRSSSDRSTVYGNLDGSAHRLGTIMDNNLYYNSTPNEPIVHTAPEQARLQREPINVQKAEARQAEIYSEPSIKELIEQSAHAREAEAQQAQERQRQEREAQERELQLSRRALLEAAKARLAQSVAAPSSAQIRFPKNAPPNEESENRLICPICLETTKNTVFRCGHAICNVCYENIISTNGICPICKEEINVNKTNPLFIGGSSNYKQKYLKYKNKYLQMKRLEKK